MSITTDIDMNVTADFGTDDNFLFETYECISSTLSAFCR